MDPQNMMQYVLRDKTTCIVAILMLLNMGTTFYMTNKSAKEAKPPPTCFYNSKGDCLPCFGHQCVNKDCCRTPNHLCASIETGKMTECPNMNMRYWRQLEDETWDLFKDNPKKAMTYLLYNSPPILLLIYLTYKMCGNLQSNLEKLKAERERQMESETHEENGNTDDSKEREENVDFESNSATSNTDGKKHYDKIKKKKKKRNNKGQC